MCQPKYWMLASNNVAYRVPFPITNPNNSAMPCQTASQCIFINITIQNCHIFHLTRKFLPFFLSFVLFHFIRFLLTISSRWCFPFACSVVNNKCCFCGYFQCTYLRMRIKRKKKSSNKYAVGSRINNQIEWTSQDIYRSNFATGQQNVNHFQPNQSMCEEEVREKVYHKIIYLPETLLIENYSPFVFESTAKRFLWKSNLLAAFHNTIE